MKKANKEYPKGTGGQTVGSRSTLPVRKFCLLVFSTFLFELNLPSLLAANTSEETKTVFETVIKAHSVMKKHTTGIGTALVEIYEKALNEKTKEPKKKTRVVDFMFKGDLSRSAIFSTTDGKRNKLEMLWALGKEGSILHSGRQANVQKKPHPLFFNQLGYDFNPNAFNQYSNMPFTTYLKRVLAGPSTLSTNRNSNGVLHLISEYRNQNTRQDLILSFDPTKGYRLVNSRWIAEYFKRTDRSYTQFLKLNWDKTRTEWYITSAKMTIYAGAHQSPKEALSAKAKLIKSTSITVTEFHPDVIVNDSKFTLDGLELPAGTRVRNKR